MSDPSASTWVEPTRRLRLRGPGGYEGRYGASLVAFVLGCYLLLIADVRLASLAASGLSGLDPMPTLVMVGQVVVALAVVLGGIWLAPATVLRRAIAAVVVLLLLTVWVGSFVWSLYGPLGGPLPPETGFAIRGWLSNAGFMAPLISSAAWLIVRERPAVTYLLLVLTVIGGVVPQMVAGGAVFLVWSVPAAAVLGVGIAWAARAIAIATRRVSRSSA